MKKQNKWLCIVNSLNKPVAQRWTLAHKLAHFLLHPDSRFVFTDGIFYCGLSDMEWQANRMAAEMLMPPKSVQDIAEIDWKASLLEIRAKVAKKVHSLQVPFHALAWAVRTATLTVAFTTNYGSKPFPRAASFPSVHSSSQMLRLSGLQGRLPSGDYLSHRAQFRPEAANCW